MVRPCIVLAVSCRKCQERGCINVINPGRQAMSTWLNQHYIFATRTDFQMAANSVTTGSCLCGDIKYSFTGEVALTVSSALKP